MAVKDEQKKAVEKDFAADPIYADARFFDMLGTEVSKKDAIERISDGKVINVTDADGNFVHRRADYFPVMDTTRVQPMHVTSDPEEDMRTKLNRLKEEVDGATKFYIVSSKEYRDFRKSLNELVKSDLDDPKAVAAKMAEVAAKADAYIHIKEADGVKITENTKARLEAANLVATLLHASVSAYTKEAVAEQAKKTEKEDSYRTFELGAKSQFSSESKVHRAFGKDETDVMLDLHESGEMDLNLEVGASGLDRATDFVSDNAYETRRMIEEDMDPDQSWRDDSDSSIEESEDLSESIKEDLEESEPEPEDIVIHFDSVKKAEKSDPSL